MFSLFKKKPQNMLISKGEVLQKDNDFAFNSRVITNEGDIIIKAQNYEKLTKEYAFFLNLIKNRALMEKCHESYHRILEPCLALFIKTVMITPCVPTQTCLIASSLLKHTLISILNLPMVKSSDSFFADPTGDTFVRDALIVMTHNLMKMQQGFSLITTPGKNYCYDGRGLKTLNTFMEIHEPTHLRFFLNKGVHKPTSRDYEKTFLLFLSALPHTLVEDPSFLHLKRDLLLIFVNFTQVEDTEKASFEVQDKPVPFYDTLSLYHLKKLDKSVENMLLHPYDLRYALGSYLTLLLKEGCFSDEPEGAYPVGYGYFIERQSLAHRRISEAMIRYFSAHHLEDHEFTLLKSLYDKEHHLPSSPKDSHDTALAEGILGQKDYLTYIYNTHMVLENLVKEQGSFHLLRYRQEQYLIDGFMLRSTFFDTHDENNGAIALDAGIEPLLKSIACYNENYQNFTSLPLLHSSLGTILKNLSKIEEKEELNAYFDFQRIHCPPPEDTTPQPKERKSRKKAASAAPEEKPESSSKERCA